MNDLPIPGTSPVWVWLKQQFLFQVVEKTWVGRMIKEI